MVSPRLHFGEQFMCDVEISLVIPVQWATCELATEAMFSGQR